MASVLTTTRILEVLQLSAGDYSALIDDILPSAKNWLVEYCKNPFLVARENLTTLNTPNPFIVGSPNVYRYSETLSVDATNRQILDSDSKFVTNGFTANVDIYVRGSRYNDGVYFCTTVSAGALTVDTIYANFMTDEDNDDEAFTVYEIRFPAAILIPFARVVQYDLAKRGADLKSFRLADYSEQYAGDGDYPPGLLNRFWPWKRMFWK